MNNDLYTYWQKAITYIRADCPDVTYNAWIKNIEPITIVNDKTMLFIVPNSFSRDIIEGRYNNMITNSLFKVYKKQLNAKYLLPSEADDYINKLTVKMTPVNAANLTLNPKYTFNTFVIGNSNRFAHTASLTVAESPGTAYNPLFIYGGVGLGKTHLMHAIGRHILDKAPEAKVVYVSSEKFTNELIQSIMYGDGGNEEFREKYRNVDVLLIDDIQFLDKKERTQEEFFHTFNTLYQSNKQIIISSDRPPKEIPTLEDRLRSRFECGLTVDIQPPDYETRIAILKKKAETESIEVSDDVIDFIASTVQTNIRELEGALNKLKAFASVINQEINCDMAKNVLKDIVEIEETFEITPERIKKIVCEHFKISMDMLDAKKRNREIVVPRQISQYLCRELTNLSFPKIGEAFGGMNHTTILSSCEKISQQIQEDSKLQAIIEELKNKITDAR